MALIKFGGGKAPEGLFFNKYLKNRMIENNKNVLLCLTGSTGSGKSYITLRIAELWYDYHFKKPFPISHVCFTIEEVLELINSKTLKRGDIIILEEAGVNLGSLDFQTKLSKLFTYILQSFRSMNLALFFNLPILSMLNKQARLLLHCNFVTMGIDFKEQTSKVKPFFHQTNVGTGKIYPKYMRVKIKKDVVPVKRFVYSIPSKEVREGYEKKKSDFLNKLTTDTLQKIKEENAPKYTDAEQDYLILFDKFNGNVKKIAEYLGTSTQAVHKAIRKARIREISKENRQNNPSNLNKGTI